MSQTIWASFKKFAKYLQNPLALQIYCDIFTPVLRLQQFWRKKTNARLESLRNGVQIIRVKRNVARRLVAWRVSSDVGKRDQRDKAADKGRARKEMFAVDDFLHIATEVARKFKRKFPKEDYDELLSDANYWLWTAFCDADKSKSKGEIDVFLRRRVTWRLWDGLRRRKRLWTDSERRVKFCSLSRFNEDSLKFGDDDLSGALYVGRQAEERRDRFNEDVGFLIDLALQDKPEEAFLFKLVFVDCLTDDEIRKTRRVSLKVVRKKRNDLLDALRPFLGEVRLGKRIRNNVVHSADQSS